MVSDYAAVADILNADVCVELNGKIIVNMSTVAPTENLKIKALVEQHGGQLPRLLFRVQSFRQSTVLC